MLQILHDFVILYFLFKPSMCSVENNISLLRERERLTFFKNIEDVGIVASHLLHL